MTKREPFAKLSGTLGYIEVAGCWLVPTTHTIWPSAFVSKINATHEARVKEAVREAVEEFRERAATLAYTHANEVGGFCECMEEISNRIRKLPTEPEGQ